MLIVVSVLSAIFMPPLVSLVVLVVFSFLKCPWEALFVGLCIDFLWLPASPFPLPFFTIAALFLVWGLEPMRRELLSGGGGLL